MSYAVLIIMGVVAWAGGVAGILLLGASASQDVRPLWRRLSTSLRFRAAGHDKLELLLATSQLVGLFWIITGIGFWLIKDVVNPDAIATLILLVFVMPILLLLGASLRPG